MKLKVLLIAIGMALGRIAFSEGINEEALKEGLERFEDWHVDADGGAQGQIRSVPGKEGNAVQFDYDLGDGQWVQIWKRLELNLNESKFLKVVFQASGSANNLQIKLVDGDGSTFGTNFEGALPTGTWSEIEVPLELLQHFWGGNDQFDATALRKIYIGVTRADGGKGTLIVDTVQFSKKPSIVAPLSSPRPVWDMDSTAGASIGGEGGTNSNMVSVEGHTGKAIQIKYDFGSGTWLQVQKQVQWNLKDFNTLSFWYRSEGAVNNLQLKFDDQDRSTFGVTVEGVKPTAEWIEVKVPFNELNYFWGGDSQLDLNNIRKVYIAVTKGEGKSGTIDIDELQFTKEIIPQEQPDLPEIKFEAEYRFEGVDVSKFVDNILGKLSKETNNGGFRTPWGGLVRAIARDQGKENSIESDQDTTLENIILLLDIVLEKRNKSEVENLLNMIFSEKHFWDQQTSVPVWLLDEKGNKKAIPSLSREPLYLVSTNQVLNLIPLVEQAGKIVGEEKSVEWAGQLLALLEKLNKENWIFPLGVIKGGVLSAAQVRRAYLSGQDIMAFYLIGQWLEKREFLKSIDKVIQVISEQDSPYGLLSDELYWDKEGVKTRQDAKQYQIYLVGQIKMATMLSKYANFLGEKKYSKIPKKLLKFLMKTYAVNGKIVSSYDSITGSPLCNFESLSIYAQVVKVALMEDEGAFAETIIREKILPSMMKESDSLTKDLLTGKTWTYDQLQILSALLKYQDFARTVKGQEAAQAKKIKAKKYMEKPFDIIDFTGLCDIDAISELGKSEGNFDGVGFSFGASSFGPTHTFSKCKENDMYFLVPIKEGPVNNAVQCLEQEIIFEPGQYESIDFLASAHHGNVSDFMTLKYQDGTTDRIPFGVGDWWHAPKLGHIARNCDLVQNGQKIRDRKVNLFHVEVKANPEKTLSSVILPSNGKAVIFSISAKRAEK